MLQPNSNFLIFIPASMLLKGHWYKFVPTNGQFGIILYVTFNRVHNSFWVRTHHSIWYGVDLLTKIAQFNEQSLFYTKKSVCTKRSALWWIFYPSPPVLKSLDILWNEGLHGVTWKSPSGQGIFCHPPSDLRQSAGQHNYALPFWRPNHTPQLSLPRRVSQVSQIRYDE